MLPKKPRERMSTSLGIYRKLEIDSESISNSLAREKKLTVLAPMKDKKKERWKPKLGTIEEARPGGKAPSEG